MIVGLSMARAVVGMGVDVVVPMLMAVVMIVVVETTVVM
jgi:hypothetical protein